MVMDAAWSHTRAIPTVLRFTNGCRVRCWHMAVDSFRDACSARPAARSMAYLDTVPNSRCTTSAQPTWCLCQGHTHS